MLCTKMRAVCLEIHSKHTNTFFGQKFEFGMGVIKPCYTRSNQWALKVGLISAFFLL